MKRTSLNSVSRYFEKMSAMFSMQEGTMKNVNMLSTGNQVIALHLHLIISNIILHPSDQRLNYLNFSDHFWHWNIIRQVLETVHCPILY